VPESLSASARIRWWYLVAVAGSAATPSSRASAIACSPARGVRRSWLIPATSWQWLISRACFSLPCLDQPVVRAIQLVSDRGHLCRDRPGAGPVPGSAGPSQLTPHPGDLGVVGNDRAPGCPGVQVPAPILTPLPDRRPLRQLIHRD
jgi:hypothetical protein